jgi:hemerythrin-like metal-binding protein
MNTFFRNLSIRTKLLSGFGIIIFVIFISGIREINTLEKLDNKRINSTEALLTSNLLKDSRNIFENEISIASDIYNSNNQLELLNSEKKHINNKNKLNKLFEKISEISLLNKKTDNENIQIIDSVKQIAEIFETEIITSFDQLTEKKYQAINIDEYYGEFIKLKTAENIDSTQIISKQTLSQILSDISSDQKKHIQKTCQQIIKKLNNTEIIALKRAQRIENESKELYITSSNTAIYYILFLLIFSIIISLIISKTILDPLSELKKNIDLLTKGELPKEVKVNNTDEIGDMGSAINELVKGLKITSEFSLEIGKGNFTTNYKPLGENDVLGNSLLSMQDSLRTAKEEEEKRQIEDAQRNRTSEGLALFGDILRKNTESLTELSNEIISGLVKFMNANQGGIFILNDENKNNIYLDLLGAYAYNRKKFVEKQIKLGEGLVGSVAIEKYTVYMTDVPNEYIEIESGIGSANPKSILLVPLKMEQEILGVIELASFNKFEKYEVELVEKIAESIASTLSTARINSRTAMLLEQSNKQASKMREQEEELLQNIEELKATQEESDKREEQLRKTLSELRLTHKMLEKHEIEQEEKITELSTENKKVNAEFSQQSIYINSIFENTSDLIIITNKFGEITNQNIVSQKLFPKTSDEKPNAKALFGDIINKELIIDEYKLSNLKSFSFENEKNITNYFKVRYIKEMINANVSYIFFLTEISKEIELTNENIHKVEKTTKIEFENTIKIEHLESILKENNIKTNNINFDDLINWNDLLSIGIEIIDQQHKRWVHLANQLYRNFKLGKEENDFIKALKEFIDYADYHFGFEEKYMIDFKYKKTESHKSIHKEFIDKLRKFYDTYEGSKPIEIYALLTYIKTWNKNHILFDDIDYVELFIENGIT